MHLYSSCIENKMLKWKTQEDGLVIIDNIQLKMYKQINILNFFCYCSMLPVKFYQPKSQWSILFLSLLPNQKHNKMQGVSKKTVYLRFVKQQEEKENKVLITKKIYIKFTF